MFPLAKRTAFLLALSVPAVLHAADYTYQQTTQLTGGSLLGMAKSVGFLSSQARHIGDPTVSTIYLKDNRLANVSAESMMWAGRQRAVTEVLRRYDERGDIKVDDLELAAEHFLAMVEAVPARMADFGVFRSKKQQERHLQYAVKLFLQGVVPR